MTETCDDDWPHLIIHTETTSSIIPDIEMTDVIHQELESKQLLPSEHYIDAGYMDAEHLFTSEKHYAIELIGPLAKSGGWQMRDMKAYDNSKFAVDWKQQIVTCPEGKTSKK